MTPFDLVMLWLIFGMIYGFVTIGVYVTTNTRYDRKNKQRAALAVLAIPIWPIALVVILLKPAFKGIRGLLDDAYQGIREMGKS